MPKLILPFEPEGEEAFKIGDDDVVSPPTFDVAYAYPGGDARTRLAEINVLNAELAAELITEYRDVVALGQMDVKKRQAAIIEDPQIVVRTEQRSKVEELNARRIMTEVAKIALNLRGLSQRDREFIKSDWNSTFWLAQDIRTIEVIDDRFRRLCGERRRTDSADKAVAGVSPASPLDDAAGTVATENGVGAHAGA